MAGEQLRVIEGKDRGELVSVGSELLLGRVAPEGAGRLGGDPKISRRHAAIRRGADQTLTIEDLGSANGTFVNEEEIDAPRALSVGDLIRVGRTVMQVTDASGQVPDAPAAGRAPATEIASPGPVLTVSPEPAEVLVVTAGRAVGQRLAFTDELVIGRGVEGGGALDDDLELSRRHARVICDANGRLTIEDLGSANGTFVNGERVTRGRVLTVGDTVRVGSTRLEVRGSEAQRGVPPTGSSAPAGRVSASPPPRGVPAAPAPRAGSAPARGGLAAEVPLGSVIAGCRVEEVIGRGDMGVVYRAEELALQRTVALKLIVAEYSSDERFRERFRRESRLAASIDHPNILPVFDAGDQEGVLYIIMRLVEGADMRELIAAEGRLEPRRAARIVSQVGAALDAAHARGMLHRDVKPSNVLLARRDHAYLTDFGLAKPADSTRGLTRQGTVIARAEYVAPEQILNQRVDARADIYALGCLLFEALAGEPPFARWSKPGPLAHLDAPTPSPLDLRPDLPPAFDDVVRRAMAKDPSERYPSAGDLGEATLVAAGGLRRASAESVVAIGEAAPSRGERVGQGPAEPAPERAVGSSLLRWTIAVAGLVIAAVGMVAALNGISTL